MRGKRFIWQNLVTKMLVREFAADSAAVTGAERLAIIRQQLIGNRSLGWLGIGFCEQPRGNGLAVPPAKSQTVLGAATPVTMWLSKRTLPVQRTPTGSHRCGRERGIGEHPFE
jgi:hypothetical protein